jgi:hypothetical protein
MVRARMAGITLTRNRLIGLALVGVLTAAGAFWLYQPDRQLRRAWNGLLKTVEARNTTRIGRVLAGDYHDRWSYTRRSILRDAGLAFLQIRRLDLGAEQVRIERDGHRATVTAILRLDAEGDRRVGEARATINALYTPFVFTWRREPGFTGAWKLVSFDQPELDLGKFRAGW